MIFETDRLYVRKWKQADLQSLHKLYSDAAITAYIGPQLTLEETKQIFDAQILRYNIYDYVGRYLIIKKSSKTIVGTFLLRKSLDGGVEIGYAFRKRDWGKGFATEIVKQGVHYVFTSTGFSSIYAFTHAKNDSSKNVLDKSGFTYLKNILEDGEWLEVFLRDKFLNEVS